ncbi:sialidase family protein [Intrasporangium sp. YIM S08009]|uniref:sialidase family protein n=1 Tax=Intrasporangium zincisolvens TaxID=3080018 RepID=UPI002B05F354|nr:exo-alpha-sialidase [Intrasporangium sp. YIM S08009]
MTVAAGPVVDGVVRVRDEASFPHAFPTALLPTPTVQCHAANLAWLPGGDLACVWFGGTQEGVADISAYLSVLPAGADTWREPVRLSDDATRSEQNPVLFTAPDGSVWLLYTAQIAGNQDTSEVRRRVSLDGGATWGEPTVLFPATVRGGVFVRQPPVVLPTGRILVPVFDCVTVPGEKWAGDADTSSVRISDDGGATWADVQVPGSLGCVHMNILLRQNGSLWACFRSRWADHVYETTSTDGGSTWAEPVATPLPNNNSSIQASALGDGRIALVLNRSSAADATARRVSLYDEIDDDGIRDDVDGPVLAGVDGADASSTPAACTDPGVGDSPRRAFWGAPRAPMTLGVSVDDGRSWPALLDVETGDGYCLSNNSRDGLNRELSYPSVLPGRDGDLHVAYTWHRRAIRYVHVPAQVVDDLARDAAKTPAQA